MQNQLQYIQRGKQSCEIKPWNKLEVVKLKMLRLMEYLIG